MQFEPHPYQRIIQDHILDHDRVNVHAAMGTGKTVATATAIDTLIAAGAVEKVLILAPKRVAQFTWPAEFAKWEHLRHLRVSVVVGGPSERLEALLADADIYVINYENINWITAMLTKTWPFDLIVADESTRIKSFRLRGGSKRARRLSKYAFRSKRWISLTGTAAPNGLIDLWGQQWFIDQGVSLGRTYTAFESRWFEKSYNGFDLKPRESAEREIPERIAPSTIVVRSEDWFALDEPIERRIYIDLIGGPRDLYDEMEQEMIVALSQDNVIAAPHAAAKTNKCRQIANGFIRNTETGVDTDIHHNKLDALEEIVEESGGEPILVAYAFTRDRDRILGRFKDAEVMTDPGRWNRGEVPMLVVHAASCGHGLNLADGGRILVFFGVDWNLEQHQQVIERIGPMRQKQAGHERNVIIYYILARDTMDDVVLERLKSKSSVQQALTAYLAEKQK